MGRPLVTMSRRLGRGTLQVLFLASGAAGLVDQVVWTRLLQEVFGVSAHAVTAVLAAYLGGLALGAWLLGPVADRSRVPLGLYGFLEIGIGATAALGPWVIRVLDPAHIWVANRLAPDSAALLAVRCVLAAAVVLPPTMLMGATLPALSRALVRNLSGVGREVAWLYALNTAGAVLGSLAAGFVLIRFAGVHGTLWLASALSTGVGVLALVLARGSEPEALPPARAPVGPSGPRASGAWLLGALALSGLASLSLEVVWTRMLVLVVGTSTYAFVTMLSTFLVGIALGSALAGVVADRLRDPRRALGWLLVLVAGASFATLPLFRVILLHGETWLEAPGGWLGTVAGRFAVSFLAMIVPTTLVGATFPIAARAWADRVDTLGGRLGQAYAANTAGNIAGALVGGFVLLPALGVQRSVAALAAIELAAAALALLPVWEDCFRWRVVLRAAPVWLGLAVAAALVTAWSPRPLPGSGGGPLDPVLFYEEGLVSTVKVFQRASDGRQLVMTVDGIVIGQSMAGVDRKQQVLAHLPFLIGEGPSPRRVLSIGLGTGILAAEVARHPGVESNACAEISPSVVAGARPFREFNGGVPESPGVQVVPDDGVNYLRRSALRYDAVIADGKSRSGHAGNALFYSLDFYRIALDHLAPGGSLVQWVPLDVAPGDFRTIVRTFVAVFPHAYVWYGPDSCFLVGSREPLVLDLDRIQRELDSPACEDLRRHGWRNAATVASLLVGDRDALATWLAGESTVNTVDRPVLEFYPPGEFSEPEALRVAANVASLSRVAVSPARDVRIVGGDAAGVGRAQVAVRDLLTALAALPSDSLVAGAALERAASADPEQGVVVQTSAETLGEIGRALDLQGRDEEALWWYRRALHVWPDFPEGLVNAARVLAAAGRMDEAEAHLASVLEGNPRNRTAQHLIGHILELRGDLARAEPHLRASVELAPEDAEDHEALGLCEAGLGNGKDALHEFQEVLRLKPDWPTAMGRVALLLATVQEPGLRDPGGAVALAERAVRSDGADPALREILATTYAAAGRWPDAVRSASEALEIARRSGDRRQAEAILREVEEFQRAAAGGSTDSR